MHFLMRVNVGFSAGTSRIPGTIFIVDLNMGNKCVIFPDGNNKFQLGTSRNRRKDTSSGPRYGGPNVWISP